MKIPPRTVIFIVGPTAIGKSSLALRIAEKIGGEIISADSMQVYRGMNVGTGKPTLREQKKIPHHLIDICSPAKTFSVFDFYNQSVNQINKIFERKKTPVVVGGTGLYIRALLNGLEFTPPPDLKLRKKLNEIFRKKGLKTLTEKLKKNDPEKAQKVDLKNPRRVIRALEIALQKNSKRHTQKAALPPIKEFGFTPWVIGLNCDRHILYQKIEARIEEMFAKGWLREAKNLSAKRISKTAKQAIGYSRMFLLLKKNSIAKINKAALIDEIKKDTRRFAKRQLTWFRKEAVDLWLSPYEIEGDIELARILGHY